MHPSDGSTLSETLWPRPGRALGFEMKQLRRLTFAICLMGAAPQMAFAQTVEEQIIRQLQDQGFTRIEVERTLLGRVRLVAISNTLERELIFNPSTGEILRDQWESISSGDVVPRVANPNRRNDDDDDGDRRGNGGSGNNSGGSGSSDDEEDDDDDDDDSDEDDDDEVNDDEDDDDEDNDDDDDDDEDDS